MSAATITKPAAQVSPGDVVLHDGEPRTVDQRVGDADSRRVYLDFEGGDRDEHGDPECFFIVGFDPAEELTVLA